MKLDQLTKDDRRKNQAELDDLNSALTFTLAERPASSGDTLDLRPFDPSADAELFSARTNEIGTAGDGSGAPAGDVAAEIDAATARVDAEEAVWLVAVEGESKVGFVFGELKDGEIDLRIWIHPAVPQVGVRHRRAAQVAFGDGRLLPGRADGRPRAGRLTHIHTSRTPTATLGRWVFVACESARRSGALGPRESEVGDDRTDPVVLVDHEGLGHGGPVEGSWVGRGRCSAWSRCARPPWR